MGKVPDARAAIDAALAASPEYPRAQMAQAQIAAAENDLPAAVELIDSVLKQTPDDLQAVLFKADLEIAQNHADQAVKALERLVEIKPDSVRARFALVTTLVRAGQVDVAAAQLDSLKKLAPKDPRTLYAEGVVAYARGNMQATPRRRPAGIERRPRPYAQPAALRARQLPSGFLPGGGRSAAYGGHQGAL